MKNQLIVFIVRALQKIIPKNTGPQRILIVSTTALGDTLWATPAIAALKDSFPMAALSVLTSPIGEEVLRHNPAIDRFYILKEPLFINFFSLWKSLRKEKFTEVLILHASQRLTLPLCALLGATTVVGTEGINKGLDTLFSDRIKDSSKHEIQRRMNIIESIGAKKGHQKLLFYLQPEENISPFPKHIILHPGSKDGFKRWPEKHFVVVGKALQKLGMSILISGTKEEAPLMHSLAGQIEGAKTLCCQSLRDFAAHLAQIDLLISNDTGPVHLACALNTPVIAIYSPTDPKRCGPHEATNAIALFKTNTCFPCMKRRCKQPFCLMQIDPEVVIDAVKKILNL